MQDKIWQDLASTVSVLATDSILVQQHLDAAVADSREQFAVLLSAVPEELRSLLVPLSPAGLTIKDYRVDCKLRIAAARTVDFSLVAAPINVGYHALYGTTKSEQSSLSIEVRAVPRSSPTSI